MNKAQSLISLVEKIKHRKIRHKATKKGLYSGLPWYWFGPNNLVNKDDDDDNDTGVDAGDMGDGGGE